MIRSLLRAVNADPYGNLFADRPLARMRKLLSPTYLVHKAQVVLYERSHPGYPWLTRDAIERIDRHLTGRERGFEWGSGNGSRWFAQRSKSLVSVEHNPEWYEKVKRDHAAAGAANVDYRLVSERDYLKAIGEFEDGYFDYVLVDGLERDNAFLRSIPKVKKGGWIVFDNVNWYLPSASKTPHSRSATDGPATPIWAKVLEEIAGWETIWTTNGINDTAIYVKP